MTVLDQAKKIVSGPRKKSYGPPQESLSKIASLWSTYLGQEIGGEDVCMLMTLLKVARFQKGKDEDSLVDIAGYASIAGLFQGDN